MLVSQAAKIDYFIISESTKNPVHETKRERSGRICANQKCGTWKMEVVKSGGFLHCGMFENMS